MRAKIVTVFLVIALILGTLAFSASAEDETCDIFVKVDGSGTVTIDGLEIDDEYTAQFPMGESVTLIATADEENEFLYWKNLETKRIVSWDAEYTFFAATYANLKAVFDEEESVSTARGEHTIIYLTSGDNEVAFLQHIPMEYSGFYSAVPTTGMKISGRTWRGWNKSADVVAATEGRVYVRPVYETDASFTVTSTVNGVTTTYDDQDYLSKLTLVAPATLNGESFSYWMAISHDVNFPNEITSFYSTYQFVVTGDVDLEAVYGAQLPGALPGVSTRVAGYFPSLEEGTVSIFAEHSVTQDYVVLQHGMLITMSQQLGNFDSQFRIDNIIPNNNDIFNNIIKLTSKDTTRTGSYRANLSNWNSVTENGVTIYPRIFARAYVIVKDADGASHTEYGPLYCVDVNYDTGSGGGTNYDDPFG